MKNKKKFNNVRILAMNSLNKQIKSNSNHIIESNEIPITIKKGSIFTFGNVSSTKYTHGLYSYPAKFIPQIVDWGIRYSGIRKGQKILDPFCGSGTTLLEAKINGIDSFGIDMNPLARLVSKVKCTPLFQENLELLWQCNDKLLEKINSDTQKILFENQKDVNLHSNWKFWFDKDIMADLIKIKRNIRNFDSNFDNKVLENLINFYLIVLAATVKRVSYQDEQQIKVKKDQKKVTDGVPKPIDVFTQLLKKKSEQITKLNDATLKYPHTNVKIIGNDARDISSKTNSIDLVITSPPYINAIDYPFAHKQELFILDLIRPEEYRPHSRNYVGVSERVLLKKMYENMQLTKFTPVDKLIKDIHSDGKDVDTNRAFILYQYFTSMEKIMLQINRVLKKSHYFIMFVGSNTIRNRYVPTHKLLMQMGKEKLGFSVKTYFYHRMKKKKFALPRNSTGNVILDEMAIVFQKE